MIFFAGLAAISTILNDRPSVVLVTDCGASIDDQFALIHLAISPEIDLRGVITTHAPNLDRPAAESSAKAARDVLDNWIALKDPPPVIAGSSLPISDPGGSKPGPAVDFLLAESRRHAADRRLAVLVIGPMTDVAMALRIDPTFADRVEIIAMAFDHPDRGGDLWNVKNDVEAYQIVMRSRIPLVIGDDSATRKRLRLSRSEARSWFPGPISDHFARWLDANAATAKEISGDADAFPIWDEVVVAHVLGMTRSESKPRLKLREDMTFDHANPEGTVSWITSIDRDRLWSDLRSKLAAKR